MQNDAVSQRIAVAAHGYTVQLSKQVGQIVVEDWRLRGWVTDNGAPAWVPPTTAYAIVPVANQGDLICKNVGTPSVYDSNISYDTPIGYNGEGGSSGGFWDLGFQDLGVNTPVVMPDGITTDTPYISSVSLSANEDLVCFYANRFQGGHQTGIWVMRVIEANGHLYWGEPLKVFSTVAIDDFNYQSQLFVTFPRLITLNNEYWIIALECSKEVNVLTYHLCYFRSKDGVHWSDREYLAGISNDTSEVGVGINKYNTNTPFTLDQLKHAYLTVSGTKVYLSSRDGSKFSCPATSLVGVENPDLKIDLTPHITTWSLSLPSAPGTAQGNYALANHFNQYNNHALLIPGARLVHRAGYVTTNGDELCTLGQFLIDEIRQETELGRNEITLVTSDYMAWLRDWLADVYFEYFSPFQSAYDLFCDLSALSVINGRFLIGLDGTDPVLTAATLDPNYITDEDMGYVNTRRVSNGTLEFEFKFNGSISENVSVAAVFQGVSDRQFFAVAYSYTDGAWVLYKATPTTAGSKIYNYTKIFTGSSEPISADTWYYAKLTQWHNHVQFETSPDHETWTTRLDYYAPVNPNEAALTENLGYFGLLGHSHSMVATPLGNSDGSDGAVSMANGTTSRYWAIKVTTGNSSGTVTNLAVLFSQENVPPAVTIGLAVDNGTGTAPADLTNYSNILYSTSSESLNYSTPDVPFWRAVPVPPYVKVEANTSYWLFWKFNGTLSGNQAWNFYSGGTQTTVSSLNGKDWSASSFNAAGLVFLNYDDGLVEFRRMWFSSAEVPKTIEYIAKDIAAKASILECTVDSFLTEADLTLDGIDPFNDPDPNQKWASVNTGILGDFVLEADVDLSGHDFAAVYFRAAENQKSFTDCCTISLGDFTSSGHRVLQFIHSDGITIETTTSLQPVPDTFHLTLATMSRFVYVYVNHCLAGIFYDPTMTEPGYFGVGYATFTNLRIPDMSAIKPYYVVETGKSALSALSELTQNSRYKFFMRFDNTLRIGSFPNRISVDTYQATVWSANRTQSARYAVNELMPQGDYYAKRWSARELELIGRRRFRNENYTDAISNEEAYLAGAQVLLRAREMYRHYAMDSVAVWPAEREDRITVTNPIDGTSADYILHSLEWQSQLGAATQRAELREFV